MTEASQSVPISYGLIPLEGPRSILLNFDLTVADKQSLKVTLAQHGIGTIQTIFIDNGNNAFPCNVVFKLTNQQISVAPFKQGFFPVVFPRGDIDLEVSTLGSVIINVMLLNIPVPPVSYSTNEPDISFVSIVNNPLIVDQIKKYFTTYTVIKKDNTILTTSPVLTVNANAARTALDITASNGNTGIVFVAPEDDSQLKWLELAANERHRITDYKEDLYLWGSATSQRVTIIDWDVLPSPPPILVFTGSSSFDATNKKFGTHSVALPIKDNTGNKLGSLPNERYWSFWARNNVSSPTTNEGIFIRGDSNMVDDIILRLNNSTLTIQRRISGGGTVSNQHTLSVDFTLWHYVIIIFKTSQTEVWFDGSLVLTSAGGIVGSSDRSLTIGFKGTSWDVANDWNGQIDEFAWFDGLLSDPTNIPSSAYTGLESNLRALAHFDNNLMNSGPNL